jgi:hypothetical protein
MQMDEIVEDLLNKDLVQLNIQRNKLFIFQNNQLLCWQFRPYVC